VLADAAGRGAPPPFAAARPSGRAPLIVSMRPVFSAEREGAGDARAVAFVRDPCGGARANAAVAAEALGLTAAEADLAAALVGGTAPADYARARRVSINTVYTHLRRLKDKTGSGRLADLIRKLNDLSVPTAARS
jgi:DNA-binding CsgD family transcriptional regulator